MERLSDLSVTEELTNQLTKQVKREWMSESEEVYCVNQRWLWSGWNKGGVYPESLQRYIWEADSYKSNYWLKIAQQRRDGLTGARVSGSEIQHKRRQTGEDQNKEGGRFTRFVKSRPKEGWTETVVDEEE